MAIVWDFRNSHVDETAMNQDGSSTGPRGNYISSESILLAAGPATYSQATDLDLAPIGVCDTIQILQNKGVIQLYEIGSRLPYIIPGRPVIQLQVSRVLFNGDSLLGALTKRSGAEATDFETNVSGKPGVDFDVNGVAGAETQGKFYLNLASHFFNQPTGLAVFFKDSEAQWVAAYYAENCIIQNHSMAIQGQNMVVMENAQIRCTGFVPMESPV